MHKLLRRFATLVGLVAVTGGAMASVTQAGERAMPVTSRYGIIHDVPASTGPVSLVRMREAGIGWVRYTFHWNRTNPAPGVYDWSEPDQAMQDFADAGLNVMAQVLWPPKWTTGVSYPNDAVPMYCLAVPSHPDCRNPALIPQAAQFEEYVRQVVGRYGGRIRYWAFWNEAHNPVFWQGSLDDLVQRILLPGYRAAKQVDPTVTIIGPEEDVPANMSYLLAAERNGRFCDVLGIHLYYPTDVPETMLNRLDTQFKPIIDAYGAGRPVWITEAGIRSWDAVSRDLQAAKLRVLLEALKQRPWIAKTFIHRVKDGGETTSASPDFGLLFPDNNYKPAWYAVRDVIAHPLGAGDGRGDIFLYNRITGAWALQFNDTVGGFDTQTGTWSPDWTVRPADFDANGLTDLLLYNQATGTAYELINTGGGFTYFRADWSPGWSISVVDFNGDGRSDLFLYSPTTGIWFRAVNVGLGIDQFAYAGGQWDPGFTIEAGDFNGDGRSDLFLYHPAAGTWWEVLTSPATDFTYYGPGIMSEGWAVTIVDFNGDGRSDVFLYRPTDGIWFEALTTGPGTFDWSRSGTWDPGFTITKGDFDGDGRGDLFLYHPAAGTWWEVLSTAWLGFSYFGPGIMSEGWTMSISDFNADGRSDVLLYRPTDGIWFTAVSAGRGAFNWTSGNWGAGWDVVASRPGPRTPTGRVPAGF